VVVGAVEVVAEVVVVAMVVAMVVVVVVAKLWVLIAKRFAEIVANAASPIKRSFTILNRATQQNCPNCFQLIT
jgi:hypothetical protein